jgi:hypothetical protein
MQLDGDETTAGRKLVPKWVKLLNDYSKHSGAIRDNVKQRQSEAVSKGEVMSFREKLLFFSSNPLEGAFTATNAPPLKSSHTSLHGSGTISGTGIRRK